MVAAVGMASNGARGTMTQRGRKERAGCAGMYSEERVM